MSRTAFITGGTGFLGTNLLIALCKKGWSLTVLHRPTSKLDYIKGLPITLVEGSITDRESLNRVIPENTDVVFHLAGDTNQWSKYNKRQTAINVAGTRNMIELAGQKGVKTFIHTSSISAWGDVSGIIDEKVPKKGGYSWLNYEKTKWLGEQEALKGLKLGMKVVILNPGSIIGAYDSSIWAPMFMALKDKKVPGLPPGSTSFVHVNDVVQAHIMAVDKGQNGHNYIISGAHTSLQDFAREINTHLNLKRTPQKIPTPLLRFVAGFSVLAARFTNRKPLMTPEIVELMSRKDGVFTNAKAIRELGYEMTSWKKGVEECYNWLKKEGFL